MKIDRRSFLSFLIGGAAGTALSPLPWKLTDDIAIWTQMWPWTPVPADGEATFSTTACTLCPGGCGISVRKIGERAVKIEGLPDHPVNKGGICILGLAGLQLLYGRGNRINGPRKKVNGGWRELSWDTAIAEVSEKLAELRAGGEPHSLACIAGSDRGTVPELLSRFLTAFGSPNFIRMPSYEDNYELALHLMQGGRVRAGFDFENSDYVLSFGSGLIEGWGSPVRMFQAHSGWKESKSTVVQAEVRLSNTAAKSDRWVAVNAGTEGALAMGLAHVIIAEDLYNHNFIDGHAAGFERYKARVMQDFSPSKVEAITGVGPAALEDVARRFAGAARPVAVCGTGRGHTPGSAETFMAVHALNALAGRINRRGGVWAVPEPDYIQWPDVPMDRIAAAGMQQARIDGAGTDAYPLARYLPSRWAQVVNAGQPDYPLKALFIAGANPCYSLPDSQAVQQALEQIPLVVSFSPYMDETAGRADYILPNHNYLEGYEDVPAPPGMPRPTISLAQPVVRPQHDTKHIGDVILLLADALGGSMAEAFPWESYEACLQETLDDKWDTLKEAGYWEQADFTPASWSAGFETASGRFEFFDPGRRIQPNYSEVEIEGARDAYPLLLVPYDSMRLASGFVGDPPFVIKAVSDTVLKGKDVLVEVNPEDAAARGLSEGSAAVLSTPKAEARVRIHLYEGIKPGVVAMPRGLGHTAYGKFLAGKGANFNTLIGPVEDPASGHDAAWGIRARLAKA